MTQEPPPAGSAGAGRTILVLDDEAGVRSFIQRILTGRGYHVLVAKDARDALDVLDANPGPLAAILCDLVLPGLGGREAANALLARRPEAKVLYMSGYRTHDSFRRNLEEHGETVLAKPFEPAELLKIVEALLES